MRLEVFASMLLVLASMAMRPAAANAAPGNPADITLGESTFVLDGPWKFRTGDDSRWAAVDFDDAAWENVDFKAPPGATDGDVGLADYVPGWAAKGHPGHVGFAWYRISLKVAAPAGRDLAILGPLAVDSAYQLYANGQLLGAVGDFSTTEPTAYSYHYPRLFVLPQSISNSGNITIAVRAWLGPWAKGAPGVGGIHIAPVIGERAAIEAQFRLQWLKVIEGYAVDTIPALLFLLMAVMSLCLLIFDRHDSAYLWLAAGLLLSGIQRGNQAVFFWFEIESIRDFVIVILAFVGSLSLGAWLMAWRSWFKLDWPAWLPRVIAGLTLVLMFAHLLAHPWLFHDAYPQAVGKVMRSVITCVRWALLLIYVFLIYRSIRLRGREGWWGLPAMLAIGVVLFSSELAAMHVTGIWFPWGVGVSLSEYASVAFDAFLFALLVRRLRSFARRNRHGMGSPITAG
jgi:hypothetical protein